MQSQKISDDMNCCLSNQCFCSCRIYRNTNEYETETLRYAENSAHQEDNYSGNKYSRQNVPNFSSYQANEEYAGIDNQTLHTLSSLREKACKFIISESENSSEFESSGNMCECQTESLRGEKSMLRRAHEIIDYVPESMFLKKVKEDSLCSDNHMNGLNFFPENGGGNYFVPPVPKNYVTQVIKEQINNGQMRNSIDDHKRMCSCCNCHHRDLQLDISGVENVDDSQRNNRNETNFKIKQQSRSQSGEKEKKKQGSKKSHHVSRSKKPIKCRRGKRKSRRLENLESQECFEPTLKRPHQNSCERCWRFASPSRSPVNKPDQRYDPNFRRAHSIADVSVAEKEFEKDGSPEIIGDQITPLRNVSPPMYDQSTKPSFGYNELEKYSPSYGPNKTVECPYFRSGTPEKYSEILRTSNNFKQAISPISPGMGTIYSDPRNNVRPKSCTPGVRRSAGNSSKVLDHLDVAEHKEKSFMLSANKESGRSPKRNTSIVPPPPKDNLLECCPCLRNKDKSGEDNGSPKNSSKPSSSSRKKGKTGEDIESPKNSSKLSSSSRKKSKTGEDVESPKNSSKLSSSIKKKKDQNSTPRPATQPESLSKKPCSCPVKKSMQTLSSDSKKNQSLPSEPRFSKSKRKLDSKTSPRTPTSGSNPPSKTRSSGEGQDKSRRFEEEKQRSSSQQSRSSSVRDAQYNEMSSYSKPAGQVMDPPHKFRECSCYLQSPQARTALNLKKSNRENLCCHCLSENENYQNNELYCCFPGPPFSPLETSGQNYVPNNKNYPRPNFDPNEKTSSNNKNCCCKCDIANICPCQKESAGKYIMHGYPDRIHNYKNVNSNAFVDGSCPPEGRRQSPERFETFPQNCIPKKYCVFYMTKSKEGKGDDVEVLVEELTQRSSNKKDTKSDALRNKMEKVSAYHSDSLALRFQKGVSELCRSNPSSRILYF